ncbi:hypothetical protein BH695_4921 [Microcystis aeruginosa PCC 7806SL]|uniref:Uncharacterized protein n=1 Tax=Microcystis aeruginosa PCC 7806SL TaxID=1903187 RepID=A0AB33BY31_MICA7|nr:hypothetical protein BH695_4921 [Microcystis aeruginosa PCC 7806SL]
MSDGKVRKPENPVSITASTICVVSWFLTAIANVASHP